MFQRQVGDILNREFRNYAIGVAIFGLVTNVALIIASFGMLSLLANVDVIDAVGSGVLLGPSMITAAVFVTFALWVTIATRVPPKNIQVSIGASLGVGFASYFAYVIVGAVLYTFGTGELFSFAIFMADQMIGPFAIIAGLIALVLTLLYLAMLSRKARGPAPLRWPWEEHDGAE